MSTGIGTLCGVCLHPRCRGCPPPCCTYCGAPVEDWTPGETTRACSAACAAQLTTTTESAS